MAGCCFLIATLLMGGSSHVGAGQVSTGELRQIVARIDHPRGGDLDKIRQAGDAAFALLLPVFERRLRLETKGARTSDGLWAAVRYLTACASENRTPEMTALYRKSQGAARDELFRWMAS